MADNRNIVVRLMADTSQYEASLAKAGKSAETLAGGLEKSGSKTGLITKGITAAGLAVAAFGVASVKMAADFDEQMSTVQANSGATASQLSQLREAALQAGASTVYTAAESAGAINDLVKAGMSVSDILSGGLTASLNLAAAGQMDVGDAAEYMSQALTMFHLTGKDATSTADALAAGADKAVGDVSDFGEALNNCGVMANSFGMNLQETVGILGLFAQNGIVGAEAGTQLNSMLMRLANPASDAKSTMEELGISTHDASGKFVGMANLAGQLHDKLGSLTDQQRQQAEATIFGSYAIKGAGIIMDAGKSGVEEWTKAVSDSGFAAQQAANKTDNLKGDLKMLESAAQSAMTKIGEGAQGPLRKLTQGLTDLITAFGNLPAGMQQAIVLGAGLIGVAGALHRAASPLNTSTSALSQNLGLLIDPVRRVTSAMPKLTSGLLDLALAAVEPSTKFGTLSTGMSRGSTAMRGLKSAAGGVVDLLGGPFGIALTIATTAITGFVTASENAKQAADNIQSAVESSGLAAAKTALVNQIQDAEVGSFHGENGILKWAEQTITGCTKLTDVMKESGISISTMTKAAQGNKTAIKEVNAAIDKYDQGLGSSRHKATALRDGLESLTKAYQSGVAGAKEKSEALDELGVSSDAATESTTDLADAEQSSGTAASEAAEQIKSMVKAMFSIEGANLSADQAVSSLDQKIGELSQTVQENGRVFDENGNLLDRFSEKGNKTYQTLGDIASGAQSAVEKILAQGEATSWTNGEIDRANSVMADARNAIIQQAEAAGMSEQAATALADRWGVSSDSVKSQLESLKQATEKNKPKIDVDNSKAKKNTKEAETNLDKFNRKLAKAKVDADDKASKKAKTAETNLDKVGKKHVKATIDATDKASKKAKTAETNLDKFNRKVAKAKLDATDKASGKVDKVNAKKLKDKKSTASVTDNATPVLRSINAYKIQDKTFTVTEKTKKEGGYTGGMFTDGHFQRFASGGMFSGYVDPAWAPGNGLSDSVYLLNARLAAGEYTHRAQAVDYYGVDAMRAINEMRVPREAFSTSRQAAGNVNVSVDTASVVSAITSLHHDLGAIISAASDDSTISDRDLGRLIRKYARA